MVGCKLSRRRGSLHDVEDKVVEKIVRVHVDQVIITQEDSIGYSTPYHAQSI